MKNRLFGAAITIIAAASLGVPAAMADDATATAAIAIDATNFPDANLRTAVAANDANKDGKLSGDELSAPTVDLADANGYGTASDLTGISLLTNLKTLILGTGHIATIDLSANTALDTLDVSGNDLATLDLSANTNLHAVRADHNQLTALTLDGNPYSRFRDVNDSTPHADDIRWLGARNITSGYADGSFGRMQPVIRQDMAAFLHRMSANVLKK